MEELTQKETQLESIDSKLLDINSELNDKFNGMIEFVGRVLPDDIPNRSDEPISDSPSPVGLINRINHTINRIYNELGWFRELSIKLSEIG